MSTIRQRLTRRLLIGWAVLLLAGGISAYLTMQRALTRQFDNMLEAKALAVASAVEFDHGSIVVDYSDWFMHEFDTNGSAFFEIRTGWGTFVERSHSFPQHIISTSSVLLPSSNPRAGRLQQVNQIPDAIEPGKLVADDLAADEKPDRNDVQLPSGIPGRAVGVLFSLRTDLGADTLTIPRGSPAFVTVDGHVREHATLIIGEDRRELDRSLATLAEVLTICGVLVLALTALIVPRLLRRDLSPLDRLAGQAQRITAESLGERFPTDGLPGELAPISARLNDLLQRLQTSFERERQFSDDLAHEFRTPVAELRSLAELALKWPDTRNADTDRNVLAIAVQMEAIVSRLLALARGEEGLTPVEPRQVELTALITNLCAPFEARAAARNLTIEADLPPALQIQSDPVLLRSIVTNLLDNAVEYAKPGGTVEVRGEAQDGQFAVRVVNPVQELGAEDVPHLFERFWRKDAARTGGGHSGLGLSLARAFATSLGCSLTAELGGDARLTMTLAGPAKPGGANKPK